MQTDLLDQLLDEIEERKRSITHVRGPKEGAVVSELDDIARIRGRPLVYPFVGSGIGNGALVELADGSVKWDFITGIGTNFFGTAIGGSSRWRSPPLCRTSRSRDIFSPTANTRNF